MCHLFSLDPWGLPNARNLKRLSLNIQLNLQPCTASRQWLMHGLNLSKAWSSKNSLNRPSLIAGSITLYWIVVPLGMIQMNWSQTLNENPKSGIKQSETSRWLTLPIEINRHNKSVWKNTTKISLKECNAWGCHLINLQTPDLMTRWCLPSNWKKSLSKNF